MQLLGQRQKDLDLPELHRFPPSSQGGPD
ncbi:hypothetical protein HD596_002118 [Nonomuraea jabiensis]|uniref:Uncharacterized protein n=1 Tax=Nonomuraea jabiensis TaxID=882448 RepID=A0A7W9L999_9ACTN|nr:hypothetical protein [Nonomuraea jabiensis]